MLSLVTRPEPLAGLEQELVSMGRHLQIFGPATDLQHPPTTLSLGRIGDDPDGLNDL